MEAAALSVIDWRPVSDILLIKIQAEGRSIRRRIVLVEENVLEVALEWIGTVQKVNDTAGHFIGLLLRIWIRPCPRTG